ncbi:MAG TPA: Spy/CpxP family protein refolding chaperone [Ramlibacter sp.]|uniref:Spy/CpxP family protein refolding chaperone n=1 Tax=Ramlibacter sp. TaxID=1917967 RepID=UPI002ED3B9E6
MKSLRRHLLTAGLLAGLGVAAVAQTQMPPAPPAAPGAPHMQGERRGPHGDPAQFRARMEERMARRLGELKTKLQIAPTQEGAWTAWTTAMKPAQHQRPDRAEFERLSTPERIDRLRAQRTQRNAEMDQRFDATKTFYTALNAEQKKVFDGEAMRFMRGGKHGGRGHGGHHRG